MNPFRSQKILPFLIFLILLSTVFSRSSINPKQLEEQKYEIKYASFVGGNNDDQAKFIVQIPQDGSYIIAGETASIDFPTTDGSGLTSTSRAHLFLLRIDSGGTELLFSTVFPTNNVDVLTGMVLDKDNNIILAGYTLSSNFPTTSGVINETADADAATEDIFIMKFNLLGDMLFSTYISAGSTDIAEGVTVDGQGNIIIVGRTISQDYPVTPGVFDELGDGISYRNDVIVTKINPEGTQIISSTLLGGDDSDYGFEVEVDSKGNIIVTGKTYSDNFPILGGYQHPGSGTYNSYDLFLSKLSPNLDLLLNSSIFGGDDLDDATSLIIDIQDNPIVAGTTRSLDLPQVRGLNESDGNRYRSDIFVFKYSSDWEDLLFSTYVSGNDDDELFDIALDQNGVLYLVGASKSTNYPSTRLNVTGDGSTTYYDMVFTKIDMGTSQMLYSTYIAGDRSDLATGIHINNESSVIITGYSWSDNFPVSSGSYQDIASNAYDAVLMELTILQKEEPTETSVVSSGESDTSSSVEPVDTVDTVVTSDITESSLSESSSTSVIFLPFVLTIFLVPFVKRYKS